MIILQDIFKKTVPAIPDKCRKSQAASCVFIAQLIFLLPGITGKLVLRKNRTGKISG